MVGLSLSYTVNCQVLVADVFSSKSLLLQLGIYLLTRFTADMEKSIVSVERIKEYQETAQVNNKGQLSLTTLSF